MLAIRKPITFTIANGASLSDAQDCEGLALYAIDMPAAWTGTELTLQGARDDGGVPGTFLDLFDWTGSELVLTVAASRRVICDPRALLDFRWLKLRSGTSAAAVAQAAERAVVGLFRSLG